MRHLEREEEAIASYDCAIALQSDAYEPWINRAAALMKLGKLDDALDSANKAISLVDESEARIMPLLTRSIIHYLALRYADAADDLLSAWKLGAKEIIEKADNYQFIEAACLASLSPETMLLRVELHWSEAAREASRSNEEEARKRADFAAEILEILVPYNGSETLIVGSVSGALVYDVLTRSANRLVMAGNKRLARENIERMQAWAEGMYGEKFDSLTAFQKDLAVMN